MLLKSKRLPGDRELNEKSGEEHCGDCFQPTMVLPAAQTAA
jgi:hypothetical protein